MSGSSDNLLEVLGLLEKQGLEYYLITFEKNRKKGITASTYINLGCEHSAVAMAECLNDCSESLFAEVYENNPELFDDMEDEDGPPN